MNPFELKARIAAALGNRLGVDGPHRTYKIAPRNFSITCLVCGRTSHNPMDVANLYCGHCHNFHEPGLPPKPEE